METKPETESTPLAGNVFNREKESKTTMEICRFSKSCIPCTMTYVEKDVFRCFLTGEHISIDDLIQFADLMGESSTKLKDRLIELRQKKVPMKNVYDIFVTDIANNYSILDILLLLFHNGYRPLAQKLFWKFYFTKPGTRAKGVPKIGVTTRGNVTSYFIRIKNLVHARVFKNPYEDVKKLGLLVKSKLDGELDEKERRLLCDKYVALKAIEYDAGSNVSKIAQEDDETFQEMTNILDQTSIPSISKVLLYGRKADAMSTLERFEEGENMLTEAYICAEVTYSCLEIVDMVYKGVVFKLSHFEHTPTRDLQKQILCDAGMALTRLSQENEDDQKFWKVLLILRMVFALLGIGKQCRIVKNYHPDSQIRREARCLLKEIDEKTLDHRKQMFYNVAIARLQDCERRMPWCKESLKKAMKLAIIGNYSEKKFIQEYGETIGINLDYLHEIVITEQTPKQLNPLNLSTKMHDLVNTLPEPFSNASVSHDFDSLSDSLENDLSSTDGDEGITSLTSLGHRDSSPQNVTERSTLTSGELSSNIDIGLGSAQSLTLSSDGTSDSITE